MTDKKEKVLTDQLLRNWLLWLRYLSDNQSDYQTDYSRKTFQTLCSNTA